MTDQTDANAHRRIVEAYYETTSSSGVTDESWSEPDGLRRRLGSWLDVDGGEVLELGSGTGELCRMLLDAGAKHVVGVNLSATEIEVARTRSDAEFVQVDILDYLRSAESESVDSIYALNILEHLSTDSLVAVLEECKRVLIGGGSLTAMVPNATSPFGGMTRYWDSTHLLAFTPSSVAQLARLVGFGAPEFRECGPVAHGIKSAVRLLLWRGIRLLIASYLLIETASRKGGIYTSDMLLRLPKASG